MRFFTEVWPWLDHLRTRDVYLGTRIHGSIASLLAGTPAIVLTHDSRTQELADYHRIPFCRIDRLPPHADVAGLYADADFATMLRGHAERFATYCEFLDRNGLDHIHRPGESGADFDRRVAQTRFPPAVRAPSRARRQAMELGWRARQSAVRSSQSAG